MVFGVARPEIAVSGNNVYVTWIENVDYGDPPFYSSVTGDIYFTRSNNNGLNFSSAINLSNNTGYSTFPVTVVAGSNVYVVWADDVDDETTTTGNENNVYATDILFKKSSDGGATFGDTINIGNLTCCGPSTPHVAGAENNVYAVWTAVANETHNGIFLLEVQIVEQALRIQLILSILPLLQNVQI